MLRFSDIECPRPSEQALAERYAAIEERLDVGTPEARQLALADCNSAPAAPQACGQPSQFTRPSQPDHKLWPAGRVGYNRRRTHL